MTDGEAGKSEGAAGGTGAQPAELARLAQAVRAIERREGPPAPPPPRQEAARRPEAAQDQDQDPAGSGAGSTAQDAPQAPARPAAAAEVPAAVPLPDKPVEAARAMLARGGAPEALAEAAVGTLGERAGELLAQDPWSVLSLAGVRPDQADGFARALLGEACRPDDERRGRAVVGWLLARAAEAGHTALEWSVLAGALARQSVPEAEEALRRAVEDGLVMVFRDEREPGGGSSAAEDEEPEADILLALDRYALAEESLADGLVRLLSTFESVESGQPAPDEDGDPEADGTDAYTAVDWQAAESAAPSPSAAALIRAVAGSGLVVHSGGEAARAEPAALVTAVRAAGLRAFAATHTEDGRRRLADLLGADAGPAALTVDGLLSGAEGPGRDEDGALDLDLLVVLDAPQLDVERAATLVEAVPDGARLVLSGDPAVLWSAGPGRAFADLLAAKVCPQVVSRTPDPGPIGEFVSGVAVGELEPAGSPGGDSGKDVVVVPVRDTGEAVHRTVQLVADSIPRALGVPAEQTQVVTLAHGGACGTRALNAALKARLNPGPGRFAGFDPGDRVVHVPGPGRAVPGTVVSGGPDGLRLDCEGTPVVVPPDRVTAALRHGWAVTAHQAVGTLWPAVVAVLPGDAPATSPLTRQWVYTAFSRARRHLSVVQGAAEELPRAVAERPAKDRTTRLRTILAEQTAGS